MLHYIIQVVSFQLIFLVIYDVFLRKETFFNTNRVYLLGTAILSLVLPFIKVPQVKEVIAQDFTIILPEVIVGGTRSVDQIVPLAENVSNTVSTSIESWSLWMIILLSGMGLAATMFLIKLGKLSWLISKNPKHWNGNVMIIQLLNSSKAFSFFNRVFIGQQLKEAEKTSILNHELVHVKQLHSLDLMCFEIMRIIFWFNPLIYMYQNRIAIIHEYIADSKAVKYQNKSEYYNELLSQVFDTNSMSFVNPFFKKSLIKKRIIMLSRTQSKRIHLIKYLLLLPMVFCMLLYTSSYAQEEIKQTNIEKNQELSDDALFDKYTQEIVVLANQGKDLASIDQAYSSNPDKYVYSREEYYKTIAYHNFMFNLNQQELMENGDHSKVTSESIKRYTKLLSYEEYLAYKKTRDAKQKWEARPKEGVIRLVVDNPEKLTSEEEEKFHSKLDELEQNSEVKGVLMVSSDGKSKLMIHDSKSIKKAIEQEQITGVPEGKIEVPFGVIDEIPMLPECEGLEDASARKKCVAQEIAKHVNAKFNTKLATQLGFTGRQRINVMFKIDKQGNVGDIRARAAHEELETEAIRVISLLPKFKPGMHKGEPVIVPYSLPILFQVNSQPGDEHSKSSESTLEEALNTSIEQTPAVQNVEVPYNAVDEVPYLPECESTNNQDERKKCVSQAVAKFVNLNFDMDLAASLDLVGVQRINTIFKIDTSGNVVDIKAKAPHPDLEKEAIRVISELPTFIPGKDEGKVVSVVYALPIKFEVVGKKRKRKKKN